MAPDDDTRDRVIRVEGDVQHLTREVEKMSTKVGEMYAILQQSRGARWAILAMAGLGGFLSAKLAPFFPWFGR